MLRFTLALLMLAATARAGLIATFTREGATDTRTDRFPALSVPAGQPATPFLKPGPFEVVWTGKLKLDKRQRLAFSFEGEGSVTLKVGGAEMLKREGSLAGDPSETKRLNPGEHDFELSYKSKEDGSASLRVYWQEAGFVRQTIPPSAFSAEETEASKTGALLRAGRLHFTRQNCAKCHISTEGFGATPMPETGEIGPILIGIGERVTEDWLQRWIADPKHLRPTTHMPTLVDATTEEGRQQAADLAAYLMGLKMGGAPGTAPDAALAEKGGVHFHELGCVACHNPPDKNSDLDAARVPLNDVASKFQPGALVAFLKKPDAFHAFGGMPDFKLSDEEAGSIAAFLTKQSAGKETKYTSAFPKGDAGRGEKLAASLQCGTCHPGLPMEPGKLTSLEDVFKKDWAAAGCAAPADKRTKNTPVLNLDDEARAALVAFGKTGKEPLTRDTPAEFATRQLQSLRCNGCHAIDETQPLLSATHEESRKWTEHVEGLHERVDQSRPQLTFIGEMLFTSYIEKMLDGTIEQRPRPWLGTRMPAFRSHAKPLAEGLSRLHGVEPSAPEKAETNPEMVEIGKKLAGAEEGFGCTTCHGVGPVKPTAAFEVEGINFQLVPDRLRAEYYHRWMDNPATVTPGTKMPKYAEGNTSQRADVLEGDAAKQYEAIWQYIHSVK